MGLEMKNLAFLFIIAGCLFATIQSNNLDLTFNPITSTCTAACTTCSEQTSNGNGNGTEVMEQMLQQMNKITDSSIPTSCQDIKERMPTSPSGVYLIADKNANTHYVYCHMEELCGSDDGWTRIAYLDMSDPSAECPTGFRLYQSNGIRACGRPSGGCQSVTFPSNGINYSEVCGRIVGYQYYSTDAIDKTIGSGHGDINSHYVDGISLTRGNPRKHIWTFMAGLDEGNVHGGGTYACPCAESSLQTGNVPSFIGNDYFCESGNTAAFTNILYTDDPLWDGRLCRSLETPCCDVPDLPWFHKELNSSTTDYIELRVCGDEGPGNEDAPFGLYEIYIKN